MSNIPPHSADECIESKLLALHTSTVCLARALAASGVLDKAAFAHELEQASRWLESFDHCGHNAQAFAQLREMLEAV